MGFNYLLLGLLPSLPENAIYGSGHFRIKKRFIIQFCLSLMGLSGF